MNSTDRLVHMANQIAANLATSHDPASAMAEHITLFWDPRMKSQILAQDGTGLSSAAAAAIEQLRKAQNGG